MSPTEKRAYMRVYYYENRERLLHYYRARYLSLSPEMKAARAKQSLARYHASKHKYNARRRATWPRELTIRKYISILKMSRVAATALYDNPKEKPAARYEHR